MSNTESIFITIVFSFLSDKVVYKEHEQILQEVSYTIDLLSIQIDKYKIYWFPL